MVSAALTQAHVTDKPNHDLPENSKRTCLEEHSNQLSTDHLSESSIRSLDSMIYTNTTFLNRAIRNAMYAAQRYGHEASITPENIIVATATHTRHRQF
jgi:hypothetical protein